MYNHKLEAFLNPKNTENKIIKRYRNRKLYDTKQSCYVTLNDIAKMIRKNELIRVIDNSTKMDITASTLTQIIFETEKKIGIYPPLQTLRQIIQHEKGNLSDFLAKLGLFDAKDLASQPVPTPPKEAHSHLKDNGNQGKLNKNNSSATQPTILPNSNKSLGGSL